MTDWRQILMTVQGNNTPPDKTDKTDKTQPVVALRHPKNHPEGVKSVLSVLSGTPFVGRERGFSEPDADLARELFEERAAIIEFDGGLTRAEAEKLAAQDPDIFNPEMWA